MQYFGNNISKDELIRLARTGDENARQELAKMFPKKVKQEKAKSVIMSTEEEIRLRDEAAQRSEAFSEERRLWFKERWG